MNGRRLLEHYLRIADAPDTIPSLRRFVIELAVRGKIGAGTSGDRGEAAILECLEPLSDGRLVHQGWSPQCESGPSTSVDEWGALKTTAIQDGAFKPEHNKRLPESLTPKPMLEVREGDILLTCAGPRARCGVVTLVRDVRPKLFISGKMYRFRANKLLIDPEYLELYLRSPGAQAAIDGMKTGSSESGLNLTKDRFAKLRVHFGSLSEQREIVARVRDVMTLCDLLEAARSAREAARDRLTAASLAHLNPPNPDPDTFADDARFALDALPALTTRADQIKALRQTILNLAARGKLVPQDPNDEPASELLSRLHAGAREKVRGKSPKSDDIAVVNTPFECPKGWAWTKVQNILDESRDISYGVIKLGDEPNSGGIPTLRCSDVRAGYIDLSGVRKVREAIEAEYARTRLLGGEVVINIRGTLGGVALVPPDLSGFNVAREVAVVPIADAIPGPFVVYLMRSPYFWDHIQNNLRGIAYKGLNLGILRNLPIPFPPLAEQHRIVAKVDELMALCDQLEASLEAAATTRRRLLDALLAEALAPAARELEAAE